MGKDLKFVKDGKIYKLEGTEVAGQRVYDNYISMLDMRRMRQGGMLMVQGRDIIVNDKGLEYLKRARYNVTIVGEQK